MTQGPRIRYARSGDLSIAYGVLGRGPIDLVTIHGGWFSIESFLEHPYLSHWLARTSSFSRTVFFDKRGTGLSDRVSSAPTLEERVDDLRAVIDAIGSTRAALWGHSDGAALAALFAASHPQRTSALILNGFAAAPQESYPIEVRTGLLNYIHKSWGTGEMLSLLLPSLEDDPAAKQWLARAERLGGTPQSVAAFVKLILETDVRQVLPSIRVPTLVMTRPSAPALPPAADCRWVADQIPGSRYVEFEGRDGLPFVGENSDEILDEVEEFLTGTKPATESHRVLATVLFTDIVGSTERAVSLGDLRWRTLLDEHDTVVGRQIAQYQGRKIGSVRRGDGVLVTFDGPARAVRCACAISDAVRGLGIEIRAGLHTGEIELRGREDIGGVAVHIADRVAERANPGEVLVSRTVTDLVVGSGLVFEDRGEHELKGVPGQWQLYAVKG